MKLKNDNRFEQGREEDLNFLDDRIQLLDTVRRMIDIELERRGMESVDNRNTGKSPPESMGHGPPCTPPPHPTLWQRIKKFLFI